MKRGENGKKGKNEKKWKKRRENGREKMREKGSYLDRKLGSSMSSIHSITFH